MAVIPFREAGVICRQTPLPPGASMLCLKLAFCTTRLVWTRCPWVPEKERRGKEKGFLRGEATKSGQARSERLSAPHFPFSSVCLLAPRLIDVVTSRSPGPGLSRARRGTDIPWRMGPLFSLCPRAPRLLPSCPVAVCGRGRGAEPGPTSVVFTPPLVFVTQRTPSALAFPGCVSRAAPPRGGEGGVPPVAPHAPLPLGVRALFRLGPRLVPLERSRTSFRCLRPSRWCRFPFPASPPTGRRCRWCRGRRAPEGG